MDSEKLIETVRAFTFIYDLEDKRYSDNEKKDAAWKEIGKILNQSGKQNHINIFNFYKSLLHSY